MDESKIADFLRTRIDEGDFPSAVYLVAQKGRTVLTGALGRAVVEPEIVPTANDTIYDLASLTKVLITGLLAAKFIENGSLALNDRVSQFLPEFETDEKRSLTVSELLTHTSHFPAWKPLYLKVAAPDEIVAEIAETPLNYRQEPVTYSDLNFILLGKIIEKIAGQTLDAVAGEVVLGPLELRDTFFDPPSNLKRRIAASENGNAFETDVCIEQGYFRRSLGGSEAIPGLREYQIWGEVHDGNAWFMGGVAGHAGLFSTAAETCRIAEQFLPGRSSLLRAETCSYFSTNLTPDKNEHRSLAFQLASTPQSTAGTHLSAQSFGHLGFTGTSLWIDPGKDRIFILLTNRTHDHSLPFVNINSVRRRFHDLAAEFLDENI